MQVVCIHEPVAAVVKDRRNMYGLRHLDGLFLNALRYGLDWPHIAFRGPWWRRLRYRIRLESSLVCGSGWRALHRLVLHMRHK